MSDQLAGGTFVSVGRFPCLSRQVSFLSRQVSFSVGRFPCLSRQVSLLGARGDHLAPGFSSHHTTTYLRHPGPSPILPS